MCGHYNFKTQDPEAVEVLTNCKNKTVEIVEGLKLRKALIEGKIHTEKAPEPVKIPKLKIEAVYL